jgi:DNA-binding transcriptional ArsR family regulator
LKEYGQMRIELSSEELARSRFALSPLFELTGVLRVLSGLSTRSPAQAWVSRLEPVFTDLRRRSCLDVVLALQGPTYSASFVTPPPRDVTQTFADDVAAVRRTPLEFARSEIERCLQARPIADDAVRKMMGSADIVDVVAETLDLAWRELVAPDWPHIRSAYERDVTSHIATLGHMGWARMLNDLHPRIRWNAGGIELRCTSSHQVRSSRGLLLVPSAFVWPRCAVYSDDLWPCALVYPARGSIVPLDTPGAKEASAAHGPMALAKLIGKTRSRLLSELAEPTTTTQLAAGLDLSIGGVGDHLAVLFHAGLLDRTRAGFRVLYCRTPLGDSVIEAAKRRGRG